MLARGALAGAIGSSSALRRLNPPNERGFMGKPPAEESADSPEVLVSELVAYQPGDFMAGRFSDASSLICHCRHCGGRSLSRFVGRTEWLDARLHSFAVWTEWLPSLLADASLTQRQLSWIRLCQQGIQGTIRSRNCSTIVLKRSLQDFPCCSGRDRPQNQLHCLQNCDNAEQTVQQWQAMRVVRSAHRNTCCLR